MQKLSDKKRVAGLKPKQLAASKTSSVRKFYDPSEGVQQTIGNHGLLRRRGEVIQCKLKIGAPNDKYEQEADEVADAVMRMRRLNVTEQKREEQQRGTDRAPRSKVLGFQAAINQRNCKEAAEQPEKIGEDEAIQTEGFLGKSTSIIQRRFAFAEKLGGGHDCPSPAACSVFRPNGGAQLPNYIRDFMEPRFGADFSRVRLHVGSEADLLNDELHSRALTYGRHIWFRKTESISNFPLLAHELVHTIQQGAVPLLETPLKKHAPALAATAGVRYPRSLGIQRAVQQSGVRSPAFVLRKIQLVIDYYKKARVLTAPNLLYQLGKAFDPGKGKDSPSNAFVYTCLGGWIDMGHFFYTAAGSALAAVGGFGNPALREKLKSVVWAKAYSTEVGQQQELEKFERMKRENRKKWEVHYGHKDKLTSEQEARRGIAGSAFTIEDLPSDYFGLLFGEKIGLFGDIYRGMKEFFRAFRAVDASSNKEVLKKMMQETLGAKDLPYRQNRSRIQVLIGPGGTAYGLCPGQGKKAVSPPEAPIKQMRLSGECGTFTGIDTSRILCALGPGFVLPPRVRQAMSSLFHADFRHVRLHTNVAAEKVAEDIAAKAFTIGNHIAFSRGAFQPNTLSGQQLLRHELEHTLESQICPCAVRGWFSKRLNHGEIRKYWLKGKEQQIVVGRNNTHEELTEKAIDDIKGQSKYSSGAITTILHWVAEPDRWKGLKLEKWAKKVPEIKDIGSVKAQVLTTKAGQKKVTPSPAEKLIHAHGEVEPSKIGIEAGTFGKDDKLAGGGAVRKLVNTAVRKFDSGDRDRGLLLLGISLHAIQDYYAHNVPLEQRTKALIAKKKNLPRNHPDYYGEHYILEDDPRLGDWRWKAAIKRTGEQLEYFYSKINPKSKNLLGKM